MNIDEARAAKAKAEQKVTAALQEFQDATGMKAGGIDLEWDFETSPWRVKATKITASLP